MASNVRCFADRSTQDALSDYASILDEKITQVPGRPGTVQGVAPLLESERLTRHFFQR